MSRGGGGRGGRVSGGSGKDLSKISELGQEFVRRGGGGEEGEGGSVVGRGRICQRYQSWDKTVSMGRGIEEKGWGKGWVWKTTVDTKVGGKRMRIRGRQGEGK